MGVQDIRTQLARQLHETNLGRLHQCPLVDDWQFSGQAAWRGRAEEAQAVGFFLQPLGIELLGAGEMKGLPPQPALTAQDVGAAEGVAGVQRQGMVEDVQDAQRHAAFSFWRRKASNMYSDQSEAL